MALDAVKSAQISCTRIAVIGDCMLDQYWTGDVCRISPEAPVPVLSVKDTEYRLGGAANVAKNLSALGAQTTLVSIVGTDSSGDQLTALVKSAGVIPVFTEQDGYRTTLKLRLVARNQQVVRADFDDTPSTAAVNASFAALKQTLTPGQTVIVSDYGKGVLADVPAIIDYANSKSCSVFVDPKGDDYSKYEGAYLITPNLSEFQRVVGSCADNVVIDNKAQVLMSNYNIENCLVTLSEKGMLLCQRGLSPIHIPAARTREVYDVSGAGDTVIAMVALGHSLGFDHDTMLRLASHAAGVVVTKMGTSSATIDEINDSITRFVS